jgi:NhaP-type Na+/H+ or K+/H+ antiporter
LLFEAAWNLRWQDLKRDLAPVILYAIIGVIISVVGIAWTLNYWAAIPLTTALLLGASLSATDPISVIALFRELGVDRRLSTLMEGESLFNDGVAVVAFSLLVGLALGTDNFTIALALSVPMILDAREEIIATVFGVVLFTLLVQGLTTQPLLAKLSLLGKQSRQQEYAEAIARRTALIRVLNHLQQQSDRPDVDPEFYRYQTVLLQGQITNVEKQINQLRSQEPTLQQFAEKQMREELLAIEADTYAEFVSSGRLNKELAPFLPQVMAQDPKN